MDRRTVEKEVMAQMLESGHCAQGTLFVMREILRLDMPDSLVRATAGLGGGIGHQGEVCGTVAGAALSLGLATEPGEGETEAGAEAKACMRVNTFMKEFSNGFGSPFCDDLTDVDFSSDREVRKYVLLGLPACVRLTTRAASMVADILEAPAPRTGQEYVSLHTCFSKGFGHCAQALVARMCEGMSPGLEIPGRMLVPLSGGIGFSGATCAALLGAALMIGSVHGVDTRQGGRLATLRQLGKTLLHGSAAFTRPALSPEAQAVLRCSELVDWFVDRYGSARCRQITGIDFLDLKEAGDFFSGNGMAACRDLVDSTAARAIALSS